MKWFKKNIEEETLENINFRHVLYTGKHTQLVLMSLNVWEEIGEETHTENDQFFRFEHWNGKCIVDGNEYTVISWDAVIIPSWAKHNIINTSTTEPLKLYTLYSPPHHKDGIVRATKALAEENSETFDGKITE